MNNLRQSLETIRQIAAQYGGTAQLAQEAGIPYSSVHSFLRRGNHRSAKLLFALAEAAERLTKSTAPKPALTSRDVVRVLDDALRGTIAVESCTIINDGLAVKFSGEPEWWWIRIHNLTEVLAELPIPTAPDIPRHTPDIEA